MIGGVIWLVWAVAVGPQWTAVLLLLSPFVLLPLGLRLASTTETGPDAPVLRRLARIAPAVAVTAASSFIPGPGPMAAVLSAPWLGFTLAVALAGAGRLLSRRTIADPGIAADAGLLFVAVGGAWLTLSRAGLNPLGFSDAIVQLTAVHFHYAGFALPIVAGFTARRLRRSVLVPAGVITGVPLTALGITAGGWLEWVAATMMALAGMAVAGQLLRLAVARTVGRDGGAVDSESGGRAGARWLIAAAGVALLAGMGLALGWAWSIRFGWSFLGLQSMAATHGSLNALGFGLLGLVGLNLIAADPAGPTGSAPTGKTEKQEIESGRTSLHLGRPSATELEGLGRRARSQRTTNAAGLLDRPTPPGFTRKVWQRSIDHGCFHSAVEAIRQWSGHDAAGIKRRPAKPDIAAGETLALAIPVGPISVTATCRIIDVVDEPDRYGFTYSTLAHHPEDGEESFMVTRHRDGAADITVTAVWRPAIIANHVCPPLTRFLQDRAINRYLDGIAAYRLPTPTPATTATSR